MKTKRGIIVLIAGIILAVALCANLCAFDRPEGFLLVKRQDTLECELKDGSRFLLRAKYLWDPIAELIPADVTTRYGGGYVVEFHPRRGPAHDISGTLDYYQGMWGWDTRDCADAYIAGDIIYGWGAYFSRATGKPVAVPDPPSSLARFFDAAAANPVSVSLRGATRLVRPLVTVSGMTGPRIVYELALIEAADQCREGDGAAFKCPILAVSQIVSGDAGKTWSEPIVTTHAEIFELGKSMEEQSFVAKPIRINGRSVESLEREARRKTEQEEAARDKRQHEIEEVWRKRDQEIFGK